jgi:hypothetical protein
MPMRAPSAGRLSLSWAQACRRNRLQGWQLQIAAAGRSFPRSNHRAIAPV